MKKNFICLFSLIHTLIYSTERVLVRENQNLFREKVFVHAKIVPVFNVRQDESLSFKQVFSNTFTEKEHIITITDKYNAPIQLILPPNTSISKENSDDILSVTLDTVEEIPKFINVNGSRDIVIKGLINKSDVEEGLYEGNVNLKTLYN